MFASPSHAEFIQLRHIRFSGNVRMAAGVKRKGLFPLIILAAIELGCPNRQTSLRLVYAPPPPAPATQQSQAEAAQAMVIEEPPPPQPAHPAPVKQTELSPPPAVPTPRQQQPKIEAPAPSQAEPAEELADAPPLQPSTGVAETAELGERINRSNTQLQAEIAGLKRRALSADDRKTLRDAQLFLDQASQAAKAGDFQRSLRLEKKADLLVSAVRNR
jgi:hypothetical protein